MNILSEKEKQVLNSYREILWLRRYVTQLEEEDQAEDPVIPESATNENIKESSKLYQQHINETRTEFDILTQYNKTKEEIVKATDEHHFTLKALYPEPSDHHNMEVKKITREYINKRDEIVMEFFQVLDELNAQKLKLTQLQRDITSQHALTREYLAEIAESKNVSDDDKMNPVRELQKSIKEQKNYISTIRQVLKGLIVQSGVDFVDDEKIQDILIRIGEDI